MKDSITETTTHFPACASLAAIGLKVKQLDLFGPIRQKVHIGQKTVKYSPHDKLYDSFITMLAGAHGQVEINTRLRSDPALQAAFGRSGCADQSVVQHTLDSCTSENVTQMQQALDEISRQQSAGYQHDYEHDWQILDVDMSGMPCGLKAAFARHPAILPSSATAEVDSWVGCSLLATTKWSWIDSSMARPN